ncbi:MAG: hypothetical protein ACYSTL_04535 [Planctomycetota bacterium]|jgi:hypothetical protein
MPTPNNSDSGGNRPPSVREIFIRHGWGLLVASLTTLIVELGTYVICLLYGAEQFTATLTSLAAATVWVAIVSGFFATGGGNWLAALLKGGIVADASAVTLIVLCVSSPFVTMLAAAKIYCTLLGMVLLGVAAVRVGRTLTERRIAAGIVAVVTTAAISVPLWVGESPEASGDNIRREIAELSPSVNPLHCIISIVVTESQAASRPESLSPALRGLFDFIASRPVRWYAAAWRFAFAAGILTLGKALTSRSSQDNATQ